ncbi:unnamed protein product [Fraxinus pennsylvanica]|uniref:Protein kinase domain-containing protein n=1 Tax=Fraxinus pennsylvanica TaxID=56036 RepID=A0AAD2DPZ2_9LAMI|nr:unnamed protein product [Fraxinus pennsylvanica]
MVSKLILFAFLSFLVTTGNSQSGDAAVMQELKKNINAPSSLGWTDSDPCNWKNVQCSKNDKRVTRIQIGRQGLKGSLPPNLNNLTSLQYFEVQLNELTGSLPSLAGLSSLQSLLLNNNNFTSIPPDFFNGMTSLQQVYLDYNPFSSWGIPDSLKSASTLQTFSANSANISGPLPDFLVGDTFLSLVNLHLAFNYLEGPLPSTLSGSPIQTLWLNGQNSNSRLNGSIAVLQNMTQLTEVWLHGNSFSGPLPDFTGLTQLQKLSLRDNSLTGPVPTSLVGLKSLMVVNLTNNMLQGPTPKFSNSVQVDMEEETNSFCLPGPGVECDYRVNILLSVARDLGYPRTFAENWKENDPCIWMGITCNGVNITVINFQRMSLTGTISPNFSEITSLQKLVLANNNLTGTIPDELTNLPNLKELDITNNHIYGRVPSFRSNVFVKTNGNVNIGKDALPTNSPVGKPSGNSPDSSSDGGRGAEGNEEKKSSTGVVVGSVIGGVCALVFAGALVYCFYRTKCKRSGKVQSPNALDLHPLHSGSEDAAKITIAGSSINGGTSETYSHGSSGPSDIHIIEADGKASLVTRLAGTFGYLAPEYAVTGRVTTKIDVFSFGVILMEMITGSKALDETLPDDRQHLVPWFRRVLLDKDNFRKAIDPTLDLHEETLASINTVAELAGHCCAREPYQRPDMGHAVNVLSSLAELWKPTEPTDPDDVYGIDYDMTLPQAVKKWQALEGMSGMDGSTDNTQMSIPTRPSGFADSFTSADGR